MNLQDGFPRFVYDLAESLSDHCDVTALAPSAPGATAKERLGGVDVRRFTYLLPRRWQALAYGHGIRNNLRRSPVAALQVLPFIAAQTLAIRSLVRAKQIQVVNSHWILPQGLSSALARGKTPRFTHVLSVHSSDVGMLADLPWGRALARFVLARCDHVIVSGSTTLKELDELAGRPTSATVQPMGINLELFSKASGLAAQQQPFPDGFLLFFGRLVEKKGAVYLLRALPRVLERWPGLGLVIVGYGPEEGALRAETQRLGLSSSVVFAGRQPHSEIVRYLHSCQLVVVPSIVDRVGETEGMPTVVVEALAAGTRVVGSAVAGIPDVLRHGENGWLCREKDTADLAEKILLALDDPPSSEITQRAQATAEGLDWSKVATRYAEVFAGNAATTARKRSS